MKTPRSPHALPLLWCLGTLVSGALFFAFVDLKPKVDENFFFASDDPQFKADQSISKTFPQPEQIILSAKGDLRSEAYVAKLAALTAAVLALPDVEDVQSLARGPRSALDALESPLWRRALVSDGEEASLVSVLFKRGTAEALVPRLEAVREKHDAPDFDLMISGAPYIVEMIRRSLVRDFLVFSAAALLIFAVATYALFRSLPVLAGTLLSCVNGSLLTLVAAEALRIKIGPLTSNLTVIVFVLTLTHIIFITFNWRHVLELGHEDPAREGVGMTFMPSFWSMVTQFLGFTSLLFVEATPLRQLGTAGIAGVVIAFAAAYLIYPPFLRWESLRMEHAPKRAAKMPDRTLFFGRPRGRFVALIVGVTAVAALGIGGLNADPDLFSYFRKGGEVREGMEYIDRQGGSIPLNVVVAAKDGSTLDSEDAYQKLWALQVALERDPAVGRALSLPLVVAEAKRVPFANLLPTGWLVRALEMPRFGAVSRYFLTEDRRRAAFFLRMNEANRDAPRLEVIERVKRLVSAEGFEAVQVGGVYFLQGQLSQLVVSSTFHGLAILIAAFVLIGGGLARSWRVTAGIFAALCLIPLWTVGVIGHFRVPFDIISSPGVNIAIGIGVDAIINMIFFVRRQPQEKRSSPELWARTCARMWRPILYSTVIICLGFGIFMLSAFPPTQRFGLSVILSTLMSPLSALFVFPWLASVPLGRRPR